MTLKTLATLTASAAMLAACAKRQQSQPIPTPTPGQLDAAYAEPTPVPALPTPAPTPMRNSYIVQKGDTLWEISGEARIMGDTFRWPLLFRANRDQIIDPDLIEPAQDLTWKEQYSLPEIQDAVGKARETPPYVPHAKPRKHLPLKY